MGTRVGVGLFGGQFLEWSIDFKAQKWEFFFTGWKGWQWLSVQIQSSSSHTKSVSSLEKIQ